jgi:glyoxylase-like metal-dependent hydrolase (beta-lactamase superfamily II)
MEQLSVTTFKVVEEDRFGQFPFMYVILGADKCVVIDTGCDCDDLEAFVTSRINRNRLPYLVVCTHVHFDHIGGNHRFEKTAGFLGIAMGGAQPKFTLNWDLTSLCCSHGTTVRPFTVTRWLKDGELLYLDDAAAAAGGPAAAACALQVLHTPGHTLDSVSLFHLEERRLFVGDLLYPFTPVPLCAVGSSPSAFARSLRKLGTLVQRASSAGAPRLLQQALAENLPTSTSASTSSGGGEGAGGLQCEDCAPAAADDDAAAAAAAAASAAAGASGAAGGAVGGGGGGYTSLGGGGSSDGDGDGEPASAVAAASTSAPAPAALSPAGPPAAPAAGGEQSGQHSSTYVSFSTLSPDHGGGGGGGGCGDDGGGSSGGGIGDGGGGAVTFACGHVEASLDGGAALRELEALVAQLRAGALRPSSRHEGGEVLEFGGGRFNLLVAHDATWKE